jgi:hypothetical protein
MFGRRKNQGAGAEPDPDLPLSVGDAAELRSLVARTFADRGTEVTIEGQFVQGADDVQFGLWNLATMCADAPRRKWPAIVQAHVDALGDMAGREPLTEEQVRNGIHERIQAIDSLPNPDWFPSATTLSDVLISIPVLDTPTVVQTVQEDHYDDVGGLQRWRDAGRAATRRLIDTEELEHAVIDPSTGVHVVMGDSFFTASLALHLADVMARFGVADTGRGVVVALPFRHQIAFHPVVGPASVEAINQLFQLAMRAFDESPGGVTPHLHLVRDGVWTRITMFDEQGQPGIAVGPELQAALEG